MLELRDLVELPDLRLADTAVCDGALCDDLERVLNDGGAIPSPGESLEECYAAVFHALPGLRAKHLPRDSAVAFEPTTVPAGKTVPLSTPRSVNSPTVQEVAPADAGIAGIDALELEVRNLLEHIGQPTLLAAWRTARAGTLSPRFTVGVIGELSRGKSNLVNGLMGEALLPTGDVPTTRLITRVMPGPRRALRWIQPSGTSTEGPLDPDAWATLFGSDEREEPAGIAQVVVPESWIEEVGIELLDTPGLGSLGSERTALVTDLLAACDATLLVVSATMPLSLTERAFLEEQVGAHAVPRVAVVLTRLDQVADGERAAVVGHVRGKLTEWAPGAMLFSTHGAPVLTETAGLDAVGFDEIRQRLTDWANAPEHLGLRIRRSASQMLTLVATARDALDAQRAVLTQRGGEVEEELQRVRQSLRLDALAWEDTRLELERRELALGAWLEDALRRATAHSKEVFGQELRRHPNPVDWRERELPFRFRQETARVAAGIESAIQERIGADQSWLRGEIRKMFDHELRASGPPGVIARDGLSSLPDTATLQDLSKWRDRSRLAIAAATITTGLLGAGPLALGVGTIGAIATERLLREKLERQRILLIDALDEALERAFLELAARAHERLRRVYAEVQRQCIEEQGLWLRARESALVQIEQRNGPGPEALECEIERARAIERALRSRLSQGDST